MPTVSIYLNDEDYVYYKSLDNKAKVLRWCFEQHRKAFEKKVMAEEPQYVQTAPTA